MSAAIDHSGRLRGLAYRREDYRTCDLCPDWRKADPRCPKCGGYGEYPKSADKENT